MPKLNKTDLPTVADATSDFLNINGVIHRRQDIHGYGSVFVPMTDAEFDDMNKFEWIIGAAYKGKSTGKIYMLQRVSGKKEGKLVALVPLIDMTNENKMSSVGAHEVTWPTVDVRGRNGTKKKAVTQTGAVVTSSKLEAAVNDFDFYADTALDAFRRYTQENGSDAEDDGDDDVDTDF